MSPKTLVTISGLPGSGTSTLSSLVAIAVGLDHLDGGSVWRAMAAERDLTVGQFSDLSEEEPDIDLELDRRLADRAQRGDVVLESRLAGWIATNERLAATRVWLACDERERARRVAVREGTEVADAVDSNQRREASERLRYRTYYGIDLGDRSIYDLELDSTATSPQALADEVVTRALGE